MAFDDLGAFLAQLEEQGELRRVSVEVDPDLELAGITERVCRRAGGGTGLLFERVTGSRFPVATNLFGSARRMALALGVADLSDLGPIMAEILAETGAGPVAGAGGRYTRCVPRLVDTPPCREVIEGSPDLAMLPFLRGWPGDGSAAGSRGYLTLPLVITADAATGETNCGIYRLQVLDDRRLLVGWNPGSGGERHYRQFQGLGRRMPVAVALGGAPAIILAASCSLPDLPDEFHVAGMLRGEPVELARCLTSGLAVPAGAEVVIEGHVEPAETAPEGPFGNHTGFYAPARQAPVLRVDAITRRLAPVVPATVIGPPPQEDCWLAKAAERLMLPWLQRSFPGITDLCLPLEGIFHRSGIVAVDTASAGDVRRLIGRLWERGPLSRSRLLIAVDAETGADPGRAWWRAINCCDWRRDVLMADDGTGGCLLGIDATRTRGDGRVPLEYGRGAAVAALVERRWREYGLP